MKVYQYFNMVICSIVFFVFMYIITGYFYVSLILGVFSFFPFCWIKKAIVKHDINTDLNIIDEHYSDNNK